MKHFPASELIINEDGSIFHLHLKPGQIADTIILVGDPGRVDLIAGYLHNIECKVCNREFATITGWYKDKHISVVGTGIGTDNIDIVLNELDALANIDLSKRVEKPINKSLTIIRIGTCGGMQPDIPVGSFLISEKSIGFDGVLNFYASRDKVCDLAFEKAFCEYVEWPAHFADPYVISADPELVARIGQKDMLRGVTVSANGFYGPQGRELRLPLAKPDLNARLESFRYDHYRITNYEMESSAVAGLSALMGHKAMTVCMVIANRLVQDAKTDYQASMHKLIEKVLERI